MLARVDPVQVEDDLTAIVKALGLNPELVKSMAEPVKSGIPVTEY